MQEGLGAGGGPGEHGGGRGRGPTGRAAGAHRGARPGCGGGGCRVAGGGDSGLPGVCSSAPNHGGGPGPKPAAPRGRRGRSLPAALRPSPPAQVPEPGYIRGARYTELDIPSGSPPRARRLGPPSALPSAPRPAPPGPPRAARDLGGHGPPPRRPTPLPGLPAAAPAPAAGPPPSRGAGPGPGPAPKPGPWPPGPRCRPRCPPARASEPPPPARRRPGCTGGAAPRACWATGQAGQAYRG